MMTSVFPAQAGMNRRSHARLLEVDLVFPAQAGMRRTDSAKAMFEVFPAQAGMNRGQKACLFTVFPAQAGMNRVPPLCCIFGSCVPRTGGDEPLNDVGE